MTAVETPQDAQNRDLRGPEAAPAAVDAHSAPGPSQPPPGWTERTEHQHHQPANPFRPARWTATGEHDTPTGPTRSRRIWIEPWQQKD